MRSLLEIAHDAEELAKEVARDYCTTTDLKAKFQAEIICSDLLKAKGRARTQHFKEHPQAVEGVA